jgi:hypothetical protein
MLFVLVLLFTMVVMFSLKRGSTADTHDILNQTGPARRLSHSCS